jgi:hypothetical protein
MRRAGLLILLLLSFWGAARLSHHATKGFRVSKLYHNTSLFDVPSPPLPQDLMDVLSQKFSYHGRGLQSFAFVSEDGKYVLKLFQNRYWWRLFWLQFTPFKQKRLYNQTKWAKTFQSYQIAYNDLKDETGLCYLHPAKSSDCPQVTLIDPLGIHHPIDLNKHGFALQKRAEMAYPFLARCARQQDLRKASDAFTSLFSLIQRKMEKGIADHDPLIRTNFGFVDGRAIEVDIGPFSYDESLKDPKRQKTILNHTLVSLHPTLLPAYYEALENF